nr:TetR/AcrR family transcriptional regulator [Nocardioides thalensis]
MPGRLIAAAAGLIAASGAGSLSARRVAAAAGTSTMAVYTHFGSMGALVRAVVAGGFDALEAAFVSDVETDDPVADVARQSAAYVHFARENRDLYAVMFGIAALGEFRPTSPEELGVGRRQTLDRVTSNLGRAAAAGRIGAARGDAPTFRWWTVVHGYALLESSGHIAPDRGPKSVLAPLLCDFFVGEGDGRARALDSVTGGLASLT